MENLLKLRWIFNFLMCFSGELLRKFARYLFTCINRNILGETPILCLNREKCFVHRSQKIYPRLPMQPRIDITLCPPKSFCFQNQRQDVYLYTCRQ